MKTGEIVLADRIRSLRQARGLSQAVLAKRMGMTPSQLCKIELGHNGLSESSIRRVAEALGVTIAELMGETETGTQAREKPVVKTDKGEVVPIMVSDLPAEFIAEVGTHALAFDAQMIGMKEALGVMAQSSLQLVFPYGVDEEAAELLARDMRYSLGVGCVPVSNLEMVLEMRGVRIVRRQYPKQFQSGAFYNARHRSLIIVLNESNTQERNDYRLVYELGAATLFAMTGFKTIRDEGAAHRLLRRFTAAFLMPEETMRTDVAQSGITPEDWTMELLLMMKARFAVSAEAYALRLESLGLINPELRVKLRDDLRAHYQKNPKAMEPQPEEQSMLAILKAVAKGGR